MIRQVFQKRFDELIAQSAGLPVKSSSDGTSDYVPSGRWEQWATSAQNLIRAVFGQNTPHYDNFVTAFEKCRGYVHEVDVLRGIFLSTKEDFEGGYVFDVELRISGEGLR